MLWDITFGQPNGGTPRQMYEECYGIATVPSGGFALACGSGVEPENVRNQDDPLNVWRAYVVKLGEDGTLQWQHTYGRGDADNAAEYLVATRDGGFGVFTDSNELGGNFGIYRLGPEPQP